MLSQFITVFFTIFIAELGDKTQLAAAMYAANYQQHLWLTLLAASLALIASTTLAILTGYYGGHHLQNIPLKLIGGILFIAVGIWYVWQHFHAAT